MMIVCPSCQASYDVPDAKIRSGRVVRCARCLREWTALASPEAVKSQEAALAAPAMQAAAEIETRSSRIGLLTPSDTLMEARERPREWAMPAKASEATREPDYQSQDEGLFDPGPMPPGFYDGRSAVRGRRWGAGIAWIATIAVLAGLVWAGYTFRGQVMHIWPASERLYAALGWHPPN